MPLAIRFCQVGLPVGEVAGDLGGPGFQTGSRLGVVAGLGSGDLAGQVAGVGFEAVDSSFGGGAVEVVTLIGLGRIGRLSGSLACCQVADRAVLHTVDAFAQPTGTRIAVVVDQIGLAHGDVAGQLAGLNPLVGALVGQSRRAHG